MSGDSDSRIKPVILVFIPAYLPGYRAGGPIRSIANMVEALSGRFDFKILTPDRDFYSADPYPDVVSDAWTRVGKADVFYLSKKAMSARMLRKILQSSEYDIIYLNSFFSRRFSMLPYALWRLGLLRKTPLVLAPRGEFSPGALALKFWIKTAYISVCNLIGWYRGRLLGWHASAESEAEDIRRTMRRPVRCHIAPPLPDPGIIKSTDPSASKAPKPRGSLSIAFVSRIDPKKNLDYALRLVAALKGKVSLSIVGPIESEAYWDYCRSLIAGLPPAVTVSHLGELPHQEIAGVFSKHDLFLFPTRGENYGHVILEAMTGGCPVVLSDQTPWRNLTQAGVGWDLPLNDPQAFQAALQQCMDMEPEAFSELCSRAWRYGLERSLDSRAADLHSEMFRRVLGSA